MNYAAMNIFTHVSLWMSPIISQAYIYKSGSVMTTGFHIKAFAVGCQISLWKGSVSVLSIHCEWEWLLHSLICQGHILSSFESLQIVQGNLVCVKWN